MKILISLFLSVITVSFICRAFDSEQAQNVLEKIIWNGIDVHWVLFVTVAEVQILNMFVKN